MDQKVTEQLVFEAFTLRAETDQVQLTENEIADTARECYEADYPQLVTEGAVAMGGWNRLRRLVGLPIKAHGFEPQEINASTRSLRQQGLLEFTHFTYRPNSVIRPATYKLAATPAASSNELSLPPAHQHNHQGGEYL